MVLKLLLSYVPRTAHHQSYSPYSLDKPTTMLSSDESIEVLYFFNLSSSSCLNLLQKSILIGA